jgi:nucleotide-binding universal stress UspA family protein
VRRIVVATDRSESADRAAAWAMDMAERYEAELVVVQVVEKSSPAVEAGPPLRRRQTCSSSGTSA